MFNLLVSSQEDSWDWNIWSLDKERLFEYTDEEIKNEYLHRIKDLVKLPSLFVVEREKKASRIGYIDYIEIKADKLVCRFDVDMFPALSTGSIEKMKYYLDIGNSELNRTHWAVKKGKLFEILVDGNYVSEESVRDSQALRKETKQIFIVHGHDDTTKKEVAGFIDSLGLEPIILHMQASGGKTIIEKLEAYTKVGFGIVLYTPCDIGAKRDSIDFTWRARQNVVFEHGYLISKLGRNRVVAIVKGETQAPNDISGVVYVPFDNNEKWKMELVKEMRNAGYRI